MGLKERVTSIKGKELIGTFFAGQMLDSAMTKLELQKFGGHELNPIGVDFINNHGIDSAMILKTAIITSLILVYALASHHEKIFKKGSKIGEINLRRGTEVVLQAGLVYTWLTFAWNSINMAPDIVNNIHF